MDGNLAELEKKLFQTPKSAALYDLYKLASFYWESYQKQTEIKEKSKLVRKAAYFSMWAVSLGEEKLETLEFYLKILREEKRSINPSEENQKNLSLVTSKWLKAAGLGEVNIIIEKKGTINIESGVVGLGESGILNWGTETDADLDLKMAEATLKGQAAFIETGEDGKMGAVIRLIAGREPVLAAGEYKKVVKASEVSRLFLSEGQVQIGDMWEVVSGNGGMEMKIEPGWYKATIYMVERSKTSGLVAVLCKEEDR